MKKIIILFNIFHVCLCIQPVSDPDLSFLSEIKENNEAVDNIEILTGSLFRTVKKYYCKVDTVEESEILLYGTRAWTFPAQDVTLSLEYPSRKKKYEDNEEFDYTITELKVILHIDGSSSRGYITSGGILQEHISMKFVLSNITSLYYQFFLYGVPKNYNLTDSYTALINLC